MKKLFILIFLLFPLSASASKLANCDTQSYEVTVNNGGQTHVVTLDPHSASIEEFGPVVSFQLKGHKPVIVTEPFDEYCIWSGKITLQRRNVGNDAGGGYGVR